MLLVLSVTISTSGCSKRALQDAVKGKAAIEAAKVLPDLPEDCREHSQTGILRGDRLDTAALKAVGAVKRQWARTDRCAEWYDDLQDGFVGPH